MVFKPSQKRKRHDIQLLINDYKLDQVKETIWARAVKHGGHATNELLESFNLVARVMVVIS